MKSKKLKAVAVRFPENIHEMLSEYCGLTQAKIASYCRYAVYDSTFNRLQADRGRLQMMKNALEQLSLPDDLKLGQKREIRDLEAKISRFESLWEELAVELHGTEDKNA
jgi:hypothetical protein